MRVKNIYNALYQGIKALNDLQYGLFVLRMDGKLMFLQDCCRNEIVISTKCDEIEKFLTKLSILKDAVYYTTNVNPLTNKQRYYQYKQILKNNYYGQK